MQDWHDPKTWKSTVTVADDDALTLEAVARSAHDAYYNIMNRLYLTRKPQLNQSYTHNKYWKAFRDMAELCIHEKWDEGTYIEEGIGTLAVSHHGNINPRSLVNVGVANAYRARLSAAQSSCAPETDWVIGIKGVVAAIATEQSEEAVLFNPTTDFPTWFRVLYPEPFNERIFKTWGNLAREDFVGSQRLRAFARKVAPKVFNELEKRWGRFPDSLEVRQC